VNWGVCEWANTCVSQCVESENTKINLLHACYYSFQGKITGGIKVKKKSDKTMKNEVKKTE
jgi:hypothetical protein